MFVDDDVRASAGLAGGAARRRRASTRDVDVFTGPIRARLEGRAPRSCGREAPPITTLDLGARGHRRALRVGRQHGDPPQRAERVGPFDVSLEHGGDEQEWQERLRAQRPGARVLYVAGAAVEHRRAGADARLRALCARRLRARPRGAALRRPPRRARRRSRASCARSPAASATCSRAAARPG